MCLQFLETTLALLFIPIHRYFCSFLKLPFTPLPLLGVFRNAIGCLFWQIQLLMRLWGWWEGANGVN